MCSAKWGKPECLLSDIEIVKVRLLPEPPFFPFQIRHTIVTCSLNGFFLGGFELVLNFVGVRM